MYTVYDTNKPADCKHHQVDSSWNRSSFDTFDEAVDYLLNWLGIYAPSRETIKLGVPYNYSAYGNSVVIKLENK